MFAVFLPLRSPNRRSPESSAVYHYTSAGVYRTVSGFNAHIFLIRTLLRRTGAGTGWRKADAILFHCVMYFA